MSLPTAMEVIGLAAAKTIARQIDYRAPEQRTPQPKTEDAMTVKELHTFTDAEIDTIADALKIADAHYRMLAELNKRPPAKADAFDMTFPDFRSTFEQQARDAADLQLKIEAGR